MGSGMKPPLLVWTLEFERRWSLPRYNRGWDGGPNGLFVSEDGVEDPDFEGTGGRG
jgi:hypothetical protein